MPESPYAPPTAEVRDMTRPAQGSIAKALAVALVVDIGATIVLGGLLGAAVALGSGIDITDPDFEAQLAVSPIYSGLGLLIGVGCSMLGGYVAARIANRDSLRVGIYFAVLLTLFGLLFAGTMSGYPVWYIVLSYLATPAAAIAGAWLWTPTAGSETALS